MSLTHRPIRTNVLFGAASAALLATAALAAAPGPSADEPKRADAPVAALAAAPADAAPANVLTEQEKTEGWKLLFDGKTTDGWRNYGKPGVAKGWEVKDGVLACNHGGDLITNDDYASFDLTLDYRISPAGNSGLMFHVVEGEKKSSMTGPEVQIQDNAQAHDPQLSGWLYELYKPPVDPKTNKPLDATKPQGEWNTLRLRLDGPHGTVWMNGVKYEEFTLGSDDWNDRVSKSKFAAMPKFAKAATGHINLQDHGNEVAFRNIKIHDLGRERADAGSEKKPDAPQK